MNNNNAIEVEYKDVKNEIYLTAPQIAQKIGDTDIRVRHWADCFYDLIGIEKLNGRKKYKESDVERFAFIKDLLDSKNFSHDQVRIYIAKHGFKYAEYDSGLVDTKDPLGFQVLASALSVEVENKLSQFKDELLTKFSEQLSNQIKLQLEMNLEMKAEIESAVDEVVSEKLDSKLSDLKSYIDTKEQEAKIRDIELIDTLKENMNKRKEEAIKEKKGIFGKIFGK